MPIFKLKNQRIQFTQQNENIKPSQGGEQNDISQDKDTTQKKKDDLIQNCSQEILNQDFDTNLTTEQQFVIQLLFQNPQREFYNEKKKDLALQFILQKSDDIEIYINELISQEQNLSYGEIVLFLELLNPKFKQLIRNIIKLYKINQSFKLFRALMCLNDYFIENYNLEGKQQEFSFEQSYSFSKELINELLLLNEEELLSLKILFGRNKFQMLFVATTKTQNNYMNILQKLVPMCPGKYNVKIQTFRALFFCLRPWLLNYLLSLNIKQYITPSVFKRTLIIIFTIMVKKDEQISKFILSNLNHIFDQPCYDFDQIWKAKKRQIIDKFNFKLNLINFFISNDLYENLQEECRSLFQEDPQFYKEEVGKVNYFECIQLNSVYLLQKNIFDQCPLDGGFTLEDFNISLTVITSQQEGRIVQDWMDNLKDTVKFKALIPFFFNIIKRGESPKKLLSIITTHRSQNKETLKIIRNMKALFQLFYNNSNEELKVMLLKLYSNMYPIPLIFQNPYLQTAQEEIDLFKFNDKLYYVFKKSFTIINFSLSEKQAQIGKTELINQLFYQQEKFETQDICQLNNNTIDIMFDTQFNGSRNFSVADAHGLIPIEILVKILPLFRMWIIQFDSESELIENYNQLNLIKNNLDLQNHKVCFIIRNYKGELEENTINNEYTAILEQIKKKEQNFIKQLIQLREVWINIKKSQNYSSPKLFFFQRLMMMNNHYFIIKDFDTKEKQISHQYFIDRDIIMDLENELSRLILKPFGFYDQEAFPIRQIEYQLKHLRERQSKIMQQENALNKTESYIKINQKGVDNNQNSIEIEKIKQQLINLEDSIKNSQLSKLLMIFCKIFDQNSNYILYLQFTDQIRKFNERNTYELQEKNQQRSNQAKKKMKVIKKLNLLQITMEYLKQELKKNLEDIAYRNIGIEMFWRELIAINQRSLNNTWIDPAEKAYEMIKKGEPFELLDGDSLKINEKFLEQLKNRFTNVGKEKVLVLSVLGPQSSGKSTILNKIFGCHFWTSVGRCTKGINLNLLKIQFKEQFNYLFDYILILDSEGLQNPNQVDPEFDKKIALFVLAMSDIILINVKGDIHQQFKNLVEMCIFTLVSMKSNLSSIKLLSWCFNQNNDANNYAPFLNQIQGIANNLNLECHNEQDVKNQAIDYNEFLNISKDNIQILGFACIEKLWRKNLSLGLTKDWRQLIINETYSEEAYLYGIRMIRDFIKKFEYQTDTPQMQSLSLFIQNINTNWQTICNLPDLLEFAELIQYKQDQLMKSKFEQIYNQESFSFKNEIRIEIHDRVRSSNVKNLALFYQIYDEKNEDLRIRFHQIEQDIQQQLTLFKYDKQIQKKIYLKYIKQLNQRINSSLKDSEVMVFEEIKNIEREYQNIKGFKLLDDFILEISKDPAQLTKLKENDDQIVIEFNKLWGEITSESEQQQNEILKEYSTKQYQCISSSFNEYRLTTDNEKNYISLFLEKINNHSPFQKDLDERIQIYEIFENELHNQVQFRPIVNSQETMRYSEIFNQNLKVRMNKPKTKYDVMDIKNFYLFQMTIYYVQQANLNDYIYKEKKKDEKRNKEKCTGKEKEGLIGDLIKILEQTQSSQQLIRVRQCQDSYQNAAQQNNQNISYNLRKTAPIFNQFDQDQDQNAVNQGSYQNTSHQGEYQKLNSQISKLILLLDFFNIEYDQELKKKLVETIQDPSKIKNFFRCTNYNDNVIKAFKKFLKSCKQVKNQQQPSLDYTKDTYLKNIKDFNKGLTLDSKQVSFSTEKEVQEYIQNFEHIIIFRELKITPFSKRYQQLESSLKYIQTKATSCQDNFRVNFIKSFSTEMFEENQIQLQKDNCYKNGFSKFEKINSWQMMYFSIYDVIKSEMTKSHQKTNKQDNSDSEEISQQNTSLIKIIMSKIEQEIINYNKSFANFGIILIGMGERCIYYYSMLIIWRFTCFKKGKGLQESTQKFKNLKQNQLQKFIADIKQNKTEQSKLKAKSFICNLYQSHIQRFYMENQANFCTDIKNKNQMTSTQLIKLLDKTILEDYQEDINLKKYTDQQIVEYITDQTKFIENYVKNKVDQIEAEIKDQYENNLRTFLLKILGNVNSNVQILRQHTEFQNAPVKAKEYFVQNENDSNNDEFYESKLFELIIQCLLGVSQNKSKFQVSKEYEEIFDIKTYQKLEFNIFDQSQFQESEQQIQLLQPFVLELSNQLDIHILKAKKETLSLGKFNGDKELQTIKLNMIGCRHTCPMCKRKCDQSYSNDHKHKCSNGHQLRGMNGVLIDDTPSLFTCDEIDDECLIITLGTEETKKWKDIRKIYDDWIFKGLDEIEQQTIKEKMMKVWNQGTGKMVCEQLKIKLKRQDIKFLQKRQFKEVINSPKIHYIFMIDDSGSMSGSPWNTAKNCCLNCLSTIEKNLNARVSVIIFNSTARIAINCEIVNLVEMEKKIQFNSGSTDFGSAFQQAYKLIVQHQNDAFQKTEVLFYTDGGAAYPKEQVKLFTEIPDHQKARIFIHCCTEEANATSLQMIVNEMNRSLIKSELKQKFQVAELQKTWAEVVSREYHNLKG
ncbi:unnamed protein product (macronuclear) [Paramecium tetraurelia]|uniref:VLIG-type G domain-containing protein n=1 Tax=Paramecium tetraurelia TaxID=5888 RepID=A0DIJ2_PARTE|nr:uncharacterized protein GSPATT00017216001 [Paramecium tetraurelia]CAK82859.1 unnamed protein product [Paramecium tetraurelia]|eukprot:XP_001450256.1 hypothetical protein (macronuclear) [Paramecium tetraurelia strain d4-2]